MIVVGFGFGGLCLYQFAGLKYYVKAVKYIKELPMEADRTKAWKSLVGDGTNNYGGIYAGDFMNRV